MRKLISFVLLAAGLGGGIAGLWVWRDGVKTELEKWIWTTEETWVEKPATQVVVSLTGADQDPLVSLSKKIGAILIPFDSRIRETRSDSPAPQVRLTGVLPAVALMPLKSLADQMLADHNARMAPARASKPSTERGRTRRRAAASASSPQSQKLRDVRRRKELLMKNWVSAEKAQERRAEARKQYRHPEELLKIDPEATAMKTKLVDLEMTLAEVIDHYTPAHPRVRELQDDIAKVRGGLDRRVMIAEEESKSRWEREQADHQRKKQALDREEQQILKLARAAVPSEPESPMIEEKATSPAPQTAVQMDWSETQTVLRELAQTKKLDAEKLSMGISGLAAAAVLLGYLVGIMGFAQSSAPPGPEPGDELPAVAAALGTAARALPRKPLPPMSEAPPAPAPEKIIAEEEMPGVSWVSMPLMPAVEKGLYTVFAPTSPAADFFSKTAENLLARLPKKDGSHVVSVSTIRSGAGTSTFLANLAVAVIARRPALLIDLHHTAPSLHTFFSIPATAQDLMSSAPWLQSIVGTPVDRLSLLPQFSPHLEKEMADLKLKKRFQAFLKDNPLNRLVLVDVAPLGRSDIFEDVAEVSDVFILIGGPDPAPATAKSALKKLAKTMKKKIILRLTRTDVQLPNALAPRPADKFEFAEVSG